MAVRIAVVGAGIVGLSSAINILDRLPEAEVEILADKFTIHTTSDGAGAIFVPEAVGMPPALEDQWGRDGAEHFFQLAQSSLSSTSGVMFMSGVELNINDEPPRWSKYMIDFRKMPEEFFKDFRKFYKHAYMFTTAVIVGRKYLPWLTNKFLSKGGRMTRRKIVSLDELADDYDLVINCSGLGARELVPDPKVQPLRGHIIRAKAPWIKHFYHSDDHKYIIPWSDNVGVGGCRQMNRFDMAILPEESENIWKKARERFPVLEGAEVQYEWIGLRPYRDTVRVEPEVINCKGKSLKVVHNYGHGAYGVSLSWGTGRYAAQLAENLLNSKPRL